MARENAKNIGKEDRERRKAAARNQAQNRKKERGSFKDYVKGVKLEMKKVVWPTNKELGSYTVMVLVFCAFFALVFWAFDSGFLALLKAVLNISV